jgi:hypothetical protein
MQGRDWSTHLGKTGGLDLCSSPDSAVPMYRPSRNANIFPSAALNNFANLEVSVPAGLTRESPP